MWNSGALELPYKKSVSKIELTSMCDAIAHRGPDGAGVQIDKDIGFKHRRLAILEIEVGLVGFPCSPAFN